MFQFLDPVATVVVLVLASVSVCALFGQNPAQWLIQFALETALLHAWNRANKRKYPKR